MLVVTLQDITELKKAMLELEQQKSLVDNILKNSSNGISVTEMIRDNQGRVIDASTILANDAAVKFSGLPLDIYLNKTAIELDPGILESGYGQTCLQTLSTGIPSMFQYYLEITGRWLELTISKMDDDHLIHIFTDVTTIKKAEQQMSKYVEELKHSNANLEQFAYAASHDLKEPIRKIQTFSDRLHILLNDKLNEKERFYFNRMSNATDRMRTLIDDLLIYSHVSTIGGAMETVDLNSIIESVREDLELEIEEKKAKIEVGNLPAVRGNKRQLQQLLQNLMSNALKFHRPQISPHIEVKSRRFEGPDILMKRISENPKDAYHLIQISDNGIGFESDYAEKIFGIFTRLHGNAEYLGSGLSIVKKVVDNHGGAVWAESSPNRGAVFNIVLPAEM
jgi:signal transduction histidine kinase